jgi:hypothetical protein
VAVEVTQRRIDPRERVNQGDSQARAQVVAATDESRVFGHANLQQNVTAGEGRAQRQTRHGPTEESTRLATPLSSSSATPGKRILWPFGVPGGTTAVRDFFSESLPAPWHTWHLWATTLPVPPQWGQGASVCIEKPPKRTVRRTTPALKGGGAAQA